jgi:hypothetical protein
MIRLCWTIYSFWGIQEILHVYGILIFITLIRRVHYCALSYPQGFFDSVTNSKGGSHPNKEEKP